MLPNDFTFLLKLSDDFHMAQLAIANFIAHAQFSSV